MQTIKSSNVLFTTPCTYMFDAPLMGVNCVDISCDGKYVAFGTEKEGASVRVYDAATLEIVRVYSCHPGEDEEDEYGMPRGGVSRMCFSDTQPSLLLCGLSDKVDGGAKLLDISSPKVGDQTEALWAFTSRMAIPSVKGKKRPKPKKTKSVDSDAESVCLSSRHAFIGAYGGRKLDGFIYMLDAEDGRFLHKLHPKDYAELAPFSMHTGSFSVPGLACVDGGSKLLSALCGDQGSCVCVWNVSLSDPEAPPSILRVVRSGGVHSLFSLGVYQEPQQQQPRTAEGEGVIVAVGDHDGSWLLDIEAGDAGAKIPLVTPTDGVFRSFVSCYAFFKSGRAEQRRLFVATGHDKANGAAAIFIWDVEQRSVVAKLEGHKGQISGVAFLPDGRLMSASYDGTARVWNVQSVTGDDGKAPSATSSTSGVKRSAEASSTAASADELSSEAAPEEPPRKRRNATAAASTSGATPDSSSANTISRATRRSRAKK